MILNSAANPQSAIVPPPLTRHALRSCPPTPTREREIRLTLKHGQPIAMAARGKLAVKSSIANRQSVSLSPAAPDATAAFQEAFVILHQHVRFNAVDQVQSHADHNQQARAAEKI